MKRVGSRSAGEYPRPATDLQASVASAQGERSEPEALMHASVALADKQRRACRKAGEYL